MPLHKSLPWFCGRPAQHQESGLISYGRLRIVAILLSFVCGSMPLTAQADVYLSIDTLAMSLDTRDGETLAQDGLRFRAGAVLTEQLDIEGQVGFARKSGGVYDRTETSSYGLYLKAFVPVAYHSSVYVLGGMSYQTYGQKVGDLELTDKHLLPSWGAGVETALTESISLSADYMQWLRNDESMLGQVSSVSVGIKIFF